MKRFLRWRWLWIVTWLAAPAAAQEGPTFVEFSFSNPGARSLGFGGAFVALADDATAAFANPAGLVQLLEPEVSIEGRQWSYRTPFTAGGRVSGTPTGIGIDTRAGLRFGESNVDLSGISFLSLVYPFEGGSLAFYRHQLAKFESQALVDGLFAEIPGGNARFQDLRTTTDLNIKTTGFAASYRVSEKLSVGAAVAFHNIDFAARSEAFEGGDTDREFFAPSPFSPDLLQRTVSLADGGSDTTFNAGFLWRPRPRWSVGGVYRASPEFELLVTERSGARSSLPPGTLLNRELDAVRAPSVFGLGVAYRSRGDALTASLEWDRVRYSSIVETLDPRIFELAGLVLEDADEIHAGLEYAFLDSRPLVAVRCGVWLDPDHRLQIRDPRREAIDRAVFQPGDDELHFAIGIGVALRAFQIDLAADFSDLVDTASLSVISKL